MFPWHSFVALQLDGAKRDGDKKTWIFDPESKFLSLSHLTFVSIKNIFFWKEEKENLTYPLVLNNKQVNCAKLWNAGKKSAVFWKMPIQPFASAERRSNEMGMLLLKLKFKVKIV